METEKKQANSQTECKPLDTKAGKAVMNGAVAATAGVAAVAVDRSLHAELHDKMVIPEVADDQETEPVEQEEVVVTPEEATPDVVAVVEPEPIASTDGIDVVVSVDEGVRIAQVDVPEPVDEIDVLPEPILPEPDLIAQTTSDFSDTDAFAETSVPDVTTASNDIACNNIADSIQQDLFA